MFNNVVSMRACWLPFLLLRGLVRGCNGHSSSETCFYPEGGEGIMDRLQQTELRAKCWTHKKKRTLSFISAMARLKSGILFTGPLTWRRRLQLMDHHTVVHRRRCSTTHFGPHIYQDINKSTEPARLDITHYRRLTRDDLDAIEILANEVLDRSLALERPSFLAMKPTRSMDLTSIKGAPKGNEIQVLRISDHDVQACGGTHHDEPGQIGSIRCTLHCGSRRCRASPRSG